MPAQPHPNIFIDPQHLPAVVALSGGGDSVALLHLAAAQGVRHAISVDHGLRDVEAELSLAASACAGLGVAHHVLRWHWDGQGNLQARARAARRDLMAAWAREHDMRSVLVGHTADDQAETVLLRLARGSGIDGLSGMKTETQAHGVVWLRPMLHLRRADLRTFLRARGASWADDPSNQDPRFDRVRARNLMDALGDLGLSAPRLVQLADHARAAQIVLDHAAQTYIEAASHAQAGAISFPSEILTLQDDTARRVLSAAVSWAGRSAYRPRWTGLKTAAERVLAEGHAPLAGARLISQEERLWVARDLSVAPPSAPFGSPWDGWYINGPSEENSALSIAPLSRGLKDCADWRALGIPRAVLETTPAVWCKDALVSAPILGIGAYSAALIRDFATHWRIPVEL